MPEQLGHFIRSRYSRRRQQLRPPGFVIIRIAANGLGKRDWLNNLRAELDNFENGVEHRHLPPFGKLVEDTTVFVQNGPRYRKTKALLLPRFENLKWRALLKRDSADTVN